MKRKSTNPFGDLLIRLSLQFPTRRAFAKAIGVHPTALSRAMTGDASAFSAETCIQIALVTQESPSVILRAAGRHHFASLLEQVYGQPKTQDEQLVLNMLSLMTPHGRADIMTMLQRMYKPPTPAPRPRRPRAAKRKLPDAVNS